ncbi:GntR family transcriptional regulator [Oceanithermus desulfurans]|uniref:GntR family transcriptional regulator n=3 Tax=Oceanithermus TaxID=208447 RepID=A0A511RMC9_9DEIN|nr:GntR family transcriptional regulator [Oceanithermus desulfurans]MBB6030987.1 DNA-binding GntR family transcriptional regulator [Oceanithermus desulfurans]GEM90804.1 GntR family transcriptional regulator [Oceanithermus desulfurans NBRC 100063]
MRIERPNLVREAAYERLKRRILEGVLRPGARLSEPALAQALGVSRTPVREALQRLAQEGLVELRPGRGARVRVLSPREVEEVYEVRALIEGEAAARAAGRCDEAGLRRLEAALDVLETADPDDYAAQIAADERFHALLVAASGNRVLEQVFHDLDAALALTRQFSRDLNQTPETRAQHRAIVAAIHAGDAAAARAAAEAHVQAFKATVARRIQEAAWT